MQKHILIIGGRGSGKSRKAEEIVNFAPGSNVQVVTGTFSASDFIKIRSNTVPDFIIFEDMTLKTFLSEQVKRFYTKEKLIMRKLYSSIYEEYVMPKLIFIVNCRRDQLPVELRRFDVIDLNPQERKNLPSQAVLYGSTNYADKPFKLPQFKGTPFPWYALNYSVSNLLDEAKTKKAVLNAQFIITAPKMFDAVKAAINLFQRNDYTKENLDKLKKGFLSIMEEAYNLPNN